MASLQQLKNRLSGNSNKKVDIPTKLDKDISNDPLTVEPPNLEIEEARYLLSLIAKSEFSGKDIQDEKIFGTCHVATGRSDHLGGNLTPDLFNSRMNASHDDILYAPPKTPEINVTSVQMYKNGESFEIFSNYEPTPWLLDKVSSVYPVEKFSALV